jgi:hypothetical protein
MGTCSQTTWAKLRTLLTWPPKLLRTLCGRDVDSRQYRPMIMTSELRFVCALGEVRTLFLTLIGGTNSNQQRKDITVVHGIYL